MTPSYDKSKKGYVKSMTNAERLINTGKLDKSNPPAQKLDKSAELREAIAELTRSHGQTIDNHSRILVPVVIDDLMGLIETSVAQETNKASLNLLTDLYHTPGNTEDVWHELIRLKEELEGRLTADKEQA